jgi:hypothetical protein
VTHNRYSVEGEGIARDILRYLQEHPDAKDTLNGISLWWLGSGWRTHKLLEVEQAVSFLLSKNLIIQTRRKGLPVYYGLNPWKRKEISEILQGS